MKQQSHLEVESRVSSLTDTTLVVLTIPNTWMNRAGHNTTTVEVLLSDFVHHILGVQSLAGLGGEEGYGHGV